MQKVVYTNAYGDYIEFGNQPPFLLRGIDSSSVSTSQITTKAVGQNGQTTHQVTYNPRTVVGHFGFVGIAEGRYSEAQMRQHWQKIANVLIPHLEGELLYINELGAYKIRCYPFELPNFETAVRTYKRFSVDFVADWPFWQSRDEHSISILKESNFLIHSALNTPFRAIIKGPANNVKVTNQTTGDFFRLSQSINTGQTMTIDTLRCRADLSDAAGSAPANYKMAINSTYFSLVPGANKITVASNSPYPVEIRYNDIYLVV